MWDLVVVGAGPAGAAAALGALRARPGARVLLLDRADFPRDKACGDGIAPHALDVLADLGVTGLLDDRHTVTHLRLEAGDAVVDREMARPAWVVPRRVLDTRLVAAAVDAGAVLRRHRVRAVRTTPGSVVLDETVRARVVVGADGVHSAIRSALAPPGHHRRALAVRAYAPTPPGQEGRQIIRFVPGRSLSYAWAFDRGDGLSNVGYGELLASGRRGAPVPAPGRAQLVARAADLLPGRTDDACDWRGAHLPLMPARLRHPSSGRVLLAGDAAALVNPVSGEGIAYALMSGAAAGRAAATSPHAPARPYRRELRRLLAAHARDTAAAARLVAAPPLLRAAVRAAARDQHVFDDLVELALAEGRLTRRTLTAIVRAVLPGPAG
ncbi:geranylgeranyl reductase family protein [Cellulomonas marina]|uniref:Geranylgeranyl reductase family n=1 Tax=Cellulomonas marina TaxID=988821 RepID=A0A1I0Z1W8_9CELL|nr:geranylgeranyl reductase family protein [Cellulomonas marina]GIG28188.1 hypothetical protein Cma02nite_07880 [Cellulomonas marina]SFB19634.1 geranylgeranyl reductase family [Cellulomonas marina]